MPAVLPRRHPPASQHLPISEQAVHEVLLSQPGTEMPAAALSALFSPRDDAERLKLTRAIARVCDMRTTPAGEPAVRLRGSSAARSPPLPIGAMAVRALLLAQPGEQMDAQALRERFAPSDEAERQLLVEAISDVGELVASDKPGAGPIVRLRREGARTPPSSGATSECGGGGGGSGGTSPASVLGRISDDAALPVTSVERELVRKVLGSSPGGLSAAQLARLIAPGDAGAKKRLARVVAEVARVAERPDAHGRRVPVLVLREAPDAPDAPDAPAADATDAAAAAAAADTPTGSEGVGCARGGAGGSGTPGAAAAASGTGTGTGTGPVAAGRREPRVVTEAMVVELLRAKGGRMLSSVLISQLQPLDASGRRALAAIVQRVCKTVLPASSTAAAHSGALVVLREALLADKVAARAATRIQRRQRTRQATLLAIVAAALHLQAAARRAAATRVVALRRIETHAALVLEAHARRRLAVDDAHRRRAALAAAIALQMHCRRRLLARRVAAREAAAHAAATAVQAAARGAFGRRGAREARRAALLASETDEQRAERVERERTALLRHKLRRRRRQQQQGAGQNGQPVAPPEPSAPAEWGEHERGDAPHGARAPAAARLLEPAAELARLAALVPHDDDAVEAADSGAAEGGFGGAAPAYEDGAADEAGALADEAPSPGAVDVHVAGEDFLAVMRKMMHQHGAELGASL